MTSKLPKLASASVKNQDSTPLFAWIRDFFLGVKRKPLPHGLLKEGGEVQFQTHTRFPNTQSSRSIEPALTEEGIHRKIADNYYYGRDGRRAVLPPTSFYNVGVSQTINPSESRAAEANGKNVGPHHNYGFDTKIPTPGFGYEWARSIENEEFTLQKDPDLARAQKFDKYLKP